MKKILITILLISSFHPIFSQNSSIELDPLTDGVIAVTSLLLNGLEYLELDPVVELPRGTVLFDYNENLDNISSYLSYGLLISPGLFLFDDKTKGDIVNIGVTYIEAFLLTNGLKNSFKALIDRERPNIYDEHEAYESFPSGHTSLAFMSAAFMTSISNIYDLENKGVITGCSFGLATTVALLRVISGSHYISDVLSGAAIGTAIGYNIPLLHLNENSSVKLGYGEGLGLMFHFMI